MSASPSLSLLLLLRYGHGRDLVGLALVHTDTLMKPQSEKEAERIPVGTQMLPLITPKKVATAWQCFV
jgi:hypothetical protein